MLLEAMPPICDKCGYDLSATKRGDAGYVCPECGKAHQRLEGLVHPPWPGWGRVLVRTCRPLVLLCAGIGLWLWALPSAAAWNWNLADLMFIGAFYGVPPLVLAGVIWGPVSEARRRVPKHRSADAYSPTRQTVIAVGIVLNLAFVVGLLFVADQWIGGQLMAAMGD